ncbi:MAG: aminodeoxychorismate lyase [Pseudomonadales bacterium]
MSLPTAYQYPWLVNGLWQDHISLDDRAVHYGDGLFETMRVVDGKIPLLPRHIDRLEEGAARLLFATDRSQITDMLNVYLREVPGKSSLTLKLIASRGSSQRGYRPAVGQPATIAIKASTYVSRVSEAQREQGVSARLCNTRLGRNSLLAGLKHLNRLEQVLAQAEWNDPHIFEGIMLDSDDYLVEGTMSNLFFVLAGKLYTPQLTDSGVKGVMREELVEFFTQSTGLSPVEGRFKLDTLADAKEVFVCNSSFGAVPLVSCEKATWRPGDFVRRAQEHIDVLYQRSDD